MKDNLMLEVKDLKKYFPIKKGFFKKIVGNVKAVDGISFDVKKGETVGLVGESGCGKSTTGRCIIKLLESTGGEINFYRDGDKVNIVSLKNKKLLRDLRSDLQIIFQDPFSSLDNRMSIRDIIAEPLRVNKIGNRKDRTEKVSALLKRVGLKDYHMNRYPHEFSGGQRQRIGIARALTLNPEFIICDEPVSALDVSIQAQILNLLSELQEEMGLTYLFIAHDLSVIEYICDRVIVMYLGKIVEIADSSVIYQNPKHPYSEALLQAIPVGNPRVNQQRKLLGGNVPNPANPPEGCNFSTRCPYVRPLCKKEEPELDSVNDRGERKVACHFADQMELTGYTNLRLT